MTAEKTNRLWLIATFLLIFTIVLSSLIIWFRYDKGQAIDITPAPVAELNGSVYIDGAVNSPGLYPLKAGESLETMLDSAGGVQNTADLSHLSLHIPQAEESNKVQLVDLNRADLWLLRSLPDIGDVRARAIIDYRNENGPFTDISQLTSVPGIGETTLAKIKNFITIVP